MRVARLATAILAIGLAGQACRAQEGKWVSLFDGQTMSGWSMVPLGGNEGQTLWEVKDGMLCGSGKASMLYSPRGDYQNFRLRAEVKINDKGNSGLYFRSRNTASFTDGYEAQINATHGDPIKTGSIYTQVHVFTAKHKPDEWFVYELEVKDREYRGKIVTAILVKVNGETLYEFQDFDRTFRKGHIGFQQHDPGSKVFIRKIEIEELPGTEG
jgi:hypothetical protein